VTDEAIKSINRFLANSQASGEWKHPSIINEMTPDQIRSFDWYRGNLEWLPSRTIMLGRHGSQAYGTSTPESDLDLKGVAVAPREYYLGFLQSFEQAEGKALDAAGNYQGPDYVIYDIRKFFKLAADCNPNIIEMLFLDDEDLYWPHCPTGLWNDVLDRRGLFLSRKARYTFSGYAVAQLKRVRTHRRWLLDPPKAEPRREVFGLKSGSGTIGKEQLGVVESQIRKTADGLAGEGWTKDMIEKNDEALVTATVNGLGLDSDLIPLVLAERRYGNAARQWQQYQTWNKERNPKRQDLEAAYGYDTKHAMHLVRLLRMAREILSGEGVKVRRPDAEELLAIRAGAWSFERLEAWAVEQEATLGPIAEASPLPEAPDRKALDRLLVSVVEEML
jgi:predicted nucleotidyltransferase